MEHSTLHWREGGADAARPISRLADRSSGSHRLKRLFACNDRQINFIAEI